MTADKINLAKLIDHSLLRPDATEIDIKGLCDEARAYGFFSVCVHPYFVGMAKKMLYGSDVKITTVIGFPLGMTLTRVKIFEAMEAVQEGAQELDIVINLCEAKAGRWESVKKEISDLIAATPQTVHKIIIETSYLSDEEKIKASLTAMDAGAEFIKTSTGFAPRTILDSGEGASKGATLRDVEIIKRVTEGKIGIKVAGGIRTLRDVLAFIEAGATRIGTSRGVEIMKEFLSS